MTCCARAGIYKFKILLLFIFLSILVLDKGRIIEFDSPNNLLQNENSVFFSMALSAGLA